MTNVEKQVIRKVKAMLEEVRRVATMERACFRDPYKPGADDPTPEIREATRLWRQSWILDPLDEAMERIEGLYGRGPRV